MKHIIIGAGVVGKATGIWLEANNEAVYFYDKDENKVKQLEEQNYKTTTNINDLFDFYWICTAEWNVPDVLKSLDFQLRNTKTIIVRSTTLPGQCINMQKKYYCSKLIHMPEFLRESTSIDDVFVPDRIIIGTKDEKYVSSLLKLLTKTFPNIPIIVTSLTSSELIKQTSNAWLSVQISFWNEINKLCKKLNINPQEIANACTLDHRISAYGSKMIGDPFSGFCLPKDIISLIKTFEEQNIEPILLKAVVNVNDKAKS